MNKIGNCTVIDKPCIGNNCAIFYLTHSDGRECGIRAKFPPRKIRKARRKRLW
jgi:hypothetical protein